MDKKQSDILKQSFLKMGADLAGFADICVLPPDVRADLPRGVSIAKSYDPAVIEGITMGPTQEYYEWYKALNEELNALSKQIEACLRAEGHSAMALPATTEKTKAKSGGIEYAKLDSARARLPHKTIATLAGIGWIGRTDLLITKEYGPRIRLASILTDAPFICDEPIIKSQCGKCEACVVACPANAARAENWSRESAESDRYNVRACDQFSRTISAEMRLDKQLCGICIAACPVARALGNCI
jgi:epoxyqueuosine reductase